MQVWKAAVIINKVRESEPGIGFRCTAMREYVDMVGAGILDPVKVTRSALQNATSVASTLLTTESVVAHNQRRYSGYAGRCSGNGRHDVNKVQKLLL